jgi:hypothetical protein
MVRSLLPVALALAVSVPALTAPAWAQEDQEAATVIWVRQTLRGAIAPASSWSPIEPDTRVKAGDTLKTADDSAAELILPSGARVTMGANTIVRLVDLQGLAPRVMTGRVHLYATPQGETHLAAGTFHMSGTDAEAVVERVNGNWRIGVLAGSFRVVDAARPPMEIEAGKLVEFAGGRAQIATLSRSQLDDMQQGFQQGGSSQPQPPRDAAAGPGLRRRQRQALGGCRPVHPAARRGPALCRRTAARPGLHRPGVRLAGRGRLRALLQQQQHGAGRRGRSGWPEHHQPARRADLHPRHPGSRPRGVSRPCGRVRP